MQRLTHKSEKGEAEPKENTTTHEIRFAAFFKFMPTFLDKLTKNLVCSGNDKLNGNKKNLANKLIFFQEKKFILMTTWTTSRSLVKQNYTRKKAFYSKLNQILIYLMMIMSMLKRFGGNF